MPEEHLLEVYPVTEVLRNYLQMTAAVVRPVRSSPVSPMAPRPLSRPRVTRSSHTLAPESPTSA